MSTCRCAIHGLMRAVFLGEHPQSQRGLKQTYSQTPSALKKRAYRERKAKT